MNSFTRAIKMCVQNVPSMATIELFFVILPSALERIRVHKTLANCCELSNRDIELFT